MANDVIITDGSSPAADIQQSVLVLSPINPSLPKQFINSCRFLAERALHRFGRWRIVLDPRGEPPPRGKCHPYRQEALSKIRQDMVDRYIADFDWVFWLDADMVSLPDNLIPQLISRCGGGIGAPVVLMDGEEGEGPAYQDGFGRGLFFDIAGFVENLRWARFAKPWFDQPGPVYELDSVGGCYLVNADIYRAGARHEIDPYSARFIEQDLQWSEGLLQRCQREPAVCFTEHFSVCQWARQHGYPVRAFDDLIARHATL